MTWRGNPREWLHFIVSLLCHDIGYVRGICRGDADGHYVTNVAGDKIKIPEGATDAALTPYHVARSKLFVRERFGKVALVQSSIPLRSRPTSSTPGFRSPRKTSTEELTIFPVFCVRRI